MKEPWENALYIIETLEEKGYQAFIVGGAVRDLLLCKDPLDIDVATSASLKEVASTFPQAKIIGKGTLQCATMSLDNVTLDVVSFADSTLEEDLKRRDFTVNAMAMDKNGKIIDPWGGQNDLCTRQVKFTESPRMRITEDPARIVRAARLVASLPGFTLAEDTKNMCIIHRELLGKVPSERIGKEVLKALSAKTSLFIKILDDLGALKSAIAPLYNLKSISQDPIKHPEGDAFVHSLLCLKHMEDLTHDPLMKAAALFHDIGKALGSSGHEKKGAKMARELFKTWAWPQKLANEVCSLIEWHDLPFTLPETKTVAKLILERGTKWIDKLFLLGYADTLAGSGDLPRYTRNRSETIRFIFNLRHGVPLRGKDLIELFPSLDEKKIGEILGDLAGKIASEGLKNRKDLLRWIEDRYHHQSKGC